MANLSHYPSSSYLNSVSFKLENVKEGYKKATANMNRLEETTAALGSELANSRNECIHLKRDLEAKGNKIKKYLKIIQELVEIEEKYCKLLVDKKAVDEELADEKKLRLEQLNQYQEEKSELQNTLQEELRILSKNNTTKDDPIETNDDQTIIKLQQENEFLRRQLSNISNQYAGLQKVLKDQQIQNIKPPTTETNAELDEPEINQPSTSTRDSCEQVTHSSLPTTNQIRLTISKRIEEGSNPIKQFHSTIVSNTSSSNTLTHQIPAPLATKAQKRHYEKPVATPLEILNVPSSNAKFPVAASRKKKKLYSRSDDTL